MSFTYSDHDQIVIELKKLMLEAGFTQRDIAAALQMKPQGITKLLAKKNFGFDDVQKVLSAMDYEMDISFKKCQK